MQPLQQVGDGNSQGEWEGLALQLSGRKDSNGAPWRLLRELTAHTGQVECIQIAPDGRSLFSASSDGTIRCWLIS